MKITRRGGRSRAARDSGPRHFMLVVVKSTSVTRLEQFSPPSFCRQRCSCSTPSDVLFERVPSF